MIYAKDVMRTCITFIFALPFLAASSVLFAQEQSSTLKEFKFVIEKTDNGVKMQSEKGTAWLELSFSLYTNETQAVDENGMTSLVNDSDDADKNLADFLVTITTTENGLELKGVKGTAWTHLRFDLDQNERQVIDQYGMTRLE